MNLCRLCKKPHLNTLIHFGKHPIVNNFLKEKDESYLEFPFELVYCEDCGFMQIMDPIDPKILYKNYFTISSWKNQPHVPRLVEVMEAIYSLEKKEKILEIGCNDGSFIDFLKLRGYKNIYGIEPTLDASTIAIDKGHEVYNVFWTYQYALNFLSGKEKFDVIIARQVLEHITDLEDFISGINYVLKDDGALVVEIPDSDWNLEYLDYTLWEEHVNYFTIESLINLFSFYGYKLVHYEVTLFSGRTIIAYFQKSGKILKQTSFTRKGKVIRYGKMFKIFKEKFSKYISKYKRSVMYGCGARSANFVNFMDIKNYLSYFIDDQTEKQNLYVPGSRLQIISSDKLSEKIDHVLLGVNTENENRVLTKRLNKGITYNSILPPSRLLPEFWEEMIND
ncbi:MULTISPECIES: class I SAM-dependent methyltransferase [Leptospira]|uniref:Methyltransferase domain-containing protein n=1 Tax=Leptospira interrogans serovar Pomona TaxID=44276 RepID=A0AA40WE66_LEPIR|nr:MULTISPECIES: class I SAM-dependent methyltransferase [Leptospira]EJO77783.1 methyltransferase domain protein [Leptospira interrogans serovar Pomona str. Kennewicki LC82-25]EKN96345.1 zinc-binding domain protein [Leptospira interrogans serovar Pomona str. Pomona]EMF35137.1 methyltransferase domain protein [Leptospira interrogans serovar Pomona str. Fox 32256]EMI71304.1 methyltransferase domain protein [Leptospira interrogans serovar Pomona str. CSL10083]EMJ61261.1 methyltransferase domain p